MFGPRFDAVMALGKIGAAAGHRAADVIRAAIYPKPECRSLVHSTLQIDPVYQHFRIIECANFVNSRLVVSMSLR